MEIKVVNKSSLKLPDYATPGAAGFDFRADIIEPLIIRPLERVLVPTGLYFEIPDGYELQVRSRSGMSLKSGVIVANTPGTVE